ncbi:hypothetical protein [Oceanobacillus sp. CAU 1775]
MLSIILITDYIISLTNFYGIIEKEKVAEIYNMQNADKITLSEIEKIMVNKQTRLKEDFVYVEEGKKYIVHTLLKLTGTGLYS